MKQVCVGMGNRLVNSYLAITEARVSIQHGFKGKYVIQQQFLL
jgi:hypothetical protein